MATDLVVPKAKRKRGGEGVITLLAGSAQQKRRKHGESEYENGCSRRQATPYRSVMLEKPSKQRIV